MDNCSPFELSEQRATLDEDRNQLLIILEYLCRESVFPIKWSRKVAAQQIRNYECIDTKIDVTVILWEVTKFGSSSSIKRSLSIRDIDSGRCSYSAQHRTTLQNFFVCI
jgi:hypothetical protein